MKARECTELHARNRAKPPGKTRRLLQHAAYWIGKHEPARRGIAGIRVPQGAWIEAFVRARVEIRHDPVRTRPLTSKEAIRKIMKAFPARNAAEEIHLRLAMQRKETALGKCLSPNIPCPVYFWDTYAFSPNPGNEANAREHSNAISALYKWFPRINRARAIEKKREEARTLKKTHAKHRIQDVLKAGEKK